MGLEFNVLPLQTYLGDPLIFFNGYKIYLEILDSKIIESSIS